MRSEPRGRNLDQIEVNMEALKEESEACQVAADTVASEVKTPAMEVIEARSMVMVVALAATRQDSRTPREEATSSKSMTKMRKMLHLQVKRPRLHGYELHPAFELPPSTPSSETPRSRKSLSRTFSTLATNPWQPQAQMEKPLLLRPKQPMTSERWSQEELATMILTTSNLQPRPAS
jgi:hypothetical protein